MNELKIFENKEFGQVRAIDIKGEPWFVAKDACDILEIKNTTDAVKRLDADEVTRLNLGSLSGETNLVNEYGLYSLILGSRKKEAYNLIHAKGFPSMKTGKRTYRIDLSRTDEYFETHFFKIEYKHF